MSKFLEAPPLQPGRHGMKRLCSLASRVSRPGSRPVIMPRINLRPFWLRWVVVRVPRDLPAWPEDAISPTGARVRFDRAPQVGTRLLQRRVRIVSSVGIEDGFEVDTNSTIAVEVLDLQGARRLDGTHGVRGGGPVSTALSNHTVHAMSEISGRPRDFSRCPV